MAAKIKHTRSTSRRVNIYSRFPSGVEGRDKEKKKKGMRGERAKGETGRMVHRGDGRPYSGGTAAMQVRDVERNARGGERTRVRDTLPVCYSPLPFHPRSLSCIHYFLVDADDDNGGGGGGDGDSDDDADNYDENRLLSHVWVSPPLAPHRSVPLARVCRF